MNKAQPNKTDFDTMKSGELLAYCQDDASKWAEAFCFYAKSSGLDVDQGWMIGWFANAIEHSSDVRRQRAQPKTRPVVGDNFPTASPSSSHQSLQEQSRMQDQSK